MVVDAGSSEAQLRSIFLSMTEGLVVRASDGRVIDANPAAGKILGLSLDQIRGRASMDPKWESIHEDGMPFPGEEQPASVTLRTGRPVMDQIMGIRLPNAEVRWISINSQPVFIAESSIPNAVIATFVDITDQRQLTADLRMTRSDLRTILDNVPGRITSWHADWTNRFANRAAEAQFGLAEGQGAGRHVREIIGEDRYRRDKPLLDAAAAGHPQSQEQIDPQPDGSLRHSRVEYVPDLRDGTVVGIYVLSTDTTELRDSYRRVRKLAQRIDTVREDERLTVAQRLHEGIAQDLFATKLSIAHLQSQAGDGRSAAEAGKHLTEAIDKCMHDMRQIAHELRPAALAHLSIAGALSALARQFGDISGLSIEFTEIAPVPKIEGEVRLIFFRTAQELLTNVARHAHASMVNIRLHADPQHVTMDVIDDGIGIDAAAFAQSGGVGLLGIRERCAEFSGTLAIRKNADSGTMMTIRMPHPFVGFS